MARMSVATALTIVESLESATASELIEASVALRKHPVEFAKVADEIYRRRVVRRAAESQNKEG